MNERDLRSRAASALLASGRAAGDQVRLLHNDGQVATFATNLSGARIVLVSAEGSPDELTARLGRVIQANNRMFVPVAHILVTGGDEEVAAVLKAAIPQVFLGQLGFHHLDASGRLHKIKGADLPWPLDLDAAASEGEDPLGDGAAAEPGPVGVPSAAPVTGYLAPRARVTTTVAVVCGALMGLSYLWNSGDRLGAVLIRMGANTPATLTKAELYRLFASAFLHGDLMHLALNMFALFAFGPMLEGLLGSKRYTILYALSGLGGALASVLARSGPFSSVGASGAIWGLMAAAFGVTYWPRGLLPEFMAKAMRRRLVMPLGINLFYSLQPGIDMQAHLGGGLVGFLAVALVGRGLVPVAARTSNDDIERGGRWATRIGAAVAVLAMSASVIVALAAGRPWESTRPPVFARTPLGDSGVSVELPTVVAAAATGEESPLPDLRLWSFGDADKMPVLVEVSVYQVDAALAPEDLDTFVAELVQEAKTPPENFRIQGEPKRVDVGGRPAVFVEYRLKNNVPVPTYQVVVKNRVVTVRGYFLDKNVPGWSDVAERIAASVQVDGAP